MKNIARLLLSAGISLITVLIVSGCQTTRETLNLDTNAEVHLYAGEHINPDQDSRASPLVIRLFKLADDRQFGREDFLNLYENAENRLGKDLLDTIVLKELAPGEHRVENLSLTPEVAYIGVLAEFVQYQDASAVTIFPITAHTSNEIHLQIEKLALKAGKPIKKSRR
ncbi:type VI secretion system lipoprotein TssJ [Simiduia agarivorans]|uniref:Uncharacterized protein n=1 Tax=Simiduia agarivorans (strain DSM 21679 / JCM 13881 / BCRC 17597 / SA1) TaxID=1117647 RepID=K4KJC2_SIMAS|nr:type VI secretion system lipoprotein TssJ [Simiduia agarivorans]AFU98088.2 hypothetical protein M5M_04405 [Simiduia agarivorans SA1 = DSM 21679]